MNTIYTQNRQDLPLIPARAEAVEIEIDAPITAADLDHLPATLRALLLKTLDDAALAHLASRFTALEDLRIYTGALTSLAPLAALKDLRSARVHVQSGPLPDLAPLTHITSLTVSHHRLDAISPQLHKLPNLQELTILGGGHLSAADAAAIATLPALHTLSLAGVLTRDADALAPLASAHALRSLSLGAAPAPSDAEIAALTAHPTLSTFSCTVRDAARAAALKPLHDKLDRLILSLITPAGLTGDLVQTIARDLHRVRALSLGEYYISRTATVTTHSADDLASLAALTQLEYLHTGSLPDHIKAADMAWLTTLPALQHIDIYGKGITAKIADILKGCKALRTIELRGAQLTDSALKKLTGLKLEAFGMMNNRAFTDAGVAELAKIKTLRRLSLPNATEASLKHLAALPALEQLDAHLYGSPDPLKHLVGADALWHINISSGNNELGLVAANALKQLPNLLVVRGIAAGAHRLAGHALATDSGAYSLEITPSIHNYT